MDTEKVTNKYGSYTDYDCYNVFNDDVVNGIISNNNGYKILIDILTQKYLDNKNV